MEKTNQQEVKNFNSGERVTETQDGSRTFSRDEIIVISSILSDVQETAGENNRGDLNLVKGVLFGNLDCEFEGYVFKGFKNKNPESRFCDQCGLLKVGEHKTCSCESGKCDNCFEEAELEKMGNKNFCPECWDNARCDAEHEASHGEDNRK